MRKNILILITIYLLSFLHQGNAQAMGPIEQELTRLRNTIDRTAAFVEMLPNTDLSQLIIGNLQKANEEYEKAIQFANNDRYVLARLHIRLAYEHLKKIENLVRSHPLFKIKFRERLDIKIQQAEEIVQTNQNPEALHMLNRAKFFRQRAYLAFRGDRSFNALEYYRLALFFADKAVQMSDGETDKSQKDWHNLISETEMLLNRVRQLVENSQNNQLRSMFEKANREMQEIDRLYTSKRVESAKRKLLILHRSLYRIIDLAENIPSIESDRLKVDLETLKYSTQSLEEDIKDIEAPTIDQLYLRVSNLVGDIENHINDGNITLARQKILLANRLIVRIYRLVESRSLNSEQELYRQIERTKQSFEEVQNTSMDESTPAELLPLTKNNIDQAEKAANENDYLTASSHLKMANRLILKFNRLRLIQALDNDQGGQIKSDLQRLHSLINKIDPAENDNKDFLIRYENAKRLSEMAEKSFSEGNLQVCKELTTTAINLITQE
jgi:hypothetical protein